MPHADELTISSITMSNTFFIERDGEWYRGTTANTTVTASDPVSEKLRLKLQHQDARCACQRCINKQLEAEGQAIIPYLDAPDRADAEKLWRTDGDIQLHTEKLDEGTAQLIEEMLAGNEAALSLHFRSNQPHQECSMGHGRIRANPKFPVTDTADSIVWTLSAAFTNERFTYELIRTTHDTRDVIVIHGYDLETGELQHRIVVYEFAKGYSYYSAVMEVINNTVQEDDVKDMIIISAPVVKNGTYAGSLRHEFKGHLSGVVFRHRNRDEETGEYSIERLPPIEYDEGDEEKIGGSATRLENETCSTAEADQREREYGMREFPSTAERLNRPSAENREAIARSLLTAEFEEMSDDVLTEISNHQHPRFRSTTDSELAGAVLEQRFITSDETILRNAVSQLRKYRYADSTAIREMSKEYPMLSRPADPEQWTLPSELYAELGLDSYITETTEITYSSVAITNGRIEQLRTLLSDTVDALQSKQYARFHYSIKALGQYLCSKLVEPTVIEVNGIKQVDF